MRLSNLSLLVSLFFLPEREQRVYTSVKNKGEFSHARERCSHRCERLKNLVVH